MHHGVLFLVPGDASYREIEAGERLGELETYERIAAAFGWPRSFR